MKSDNKIHPESENDSYHFGSIREVKFPELKPVNAQFDNNYDIKDLDYIIAYT